MFTMVSGQVDFVVGVDTYRDTNVAAIVEAATGGVVDHLHCTTDAMGYQRALAFGVLHAPGRRVWAIEDTGSFGSGLTTFLLENREWVVESTGPPARPAGTVPRVTSWMRSAPPGKPCLASISPPSAPATTGKALRVLLAARHGAVVGRIRLSAR